MLNVVLIEPEIPPNTGNIGRLCLATRSRLHLVKPLGFSLDDAALRRAGLDYWHEVDVRLWDGFADLEAAHRDARFWFMTTKTERVYWDAEFRSGDFLVFGRETKGLPEPLLAARATEVLTIPMPGSTRSLNLATAVGVVLYEAVRQIQMSGTAFDDGGETLRA
jgi:tRNA (cytidine/uridine-2'-O-)-methyltransferase